jgi:hypothetical protein
MKVQITLDTCDALDRDAFLALAQLLGGTTVAAEPMVTEARPTALEHLATINREEPTTPVEEPKYENTATAMPLEEPSAEEEAVREEPKTISEDKWAEILLAKRKELGLVGEDGNSVGAPFASAKNEFIDFVKEQSKKYGADSPKRLTPEKLYLFVDEVFSKIVYDPATGFTTTAILNQPPF